MEEERPPAGGVFVWSDALLIGLGLWEGWVVDEFEAVLVGEKGEER